jgi:tetratricopeptide (TPR) repeat protein
MVPPVKRSEAARQQYELGLSFQGRGRLDEAVACYRATIAEEPEHAAAHINLGAALLGLGRAIEAATFLQRAIEINPSIPEGHYNLGIAKYENGELQDAIACFRKAIRLRPRYPDAFNNLGRTLRRLARLDEAADSFRHALSLQASMVEAKSNLGLVLEDQGEVDEAIACFSQALQLCPGFADCHNNLGKALLTKRCIGEAVSSLRRAVELKPTLAEAWCNLASALLESKKSEEALECGQRAIALRPDFADAMINIGAALILQRKFAEAIAYYQEALQLKPESHLPIENMGIALHELGRFAESAAHLEQALQLKADSAAARSMNATQNLLLGNFEHGWAEYEWRWKTGQLPVRELGEPRWQGESLAGKTILIWAEQGLGDTLQFVRYAALVKKLGAAVLFECQQPLYKLLAGHAATRGLRAMLAIDHLFAEGDELPPFDYQIPLLSLPGVFKTTLETIPADVPYLFAEPRLIDEWETKLAEFKVQRSKFQVECGGDGGPAEVAHPGPTLLVGINWQGRPGKGPWQARNVPVEMFESLEDIPGVRLVSLQKDTGNSEGRIQNSEMVGGGKGHSAFCILNCEFDTLHGAFMDTAAIMMNLDLVITSDTSVAHLAGALGVSVWVALPFVPDWRWLLDRSDSPWYPTMRLFRQKRLGDWAAVFLEIKAALVERVNVARSGDRPQP